jgi:predicted DNA-binding transcriptional regulator AlpA
MGKTHKTTTPAPQVEHSEKPEVTTSSSNHQIRLLSKSEMLRRTGVSYSSIWNWIIAGTFPPGRALGDGKRGRIMWIEHEVQAWIESRPVRMPKSAKAA